MPHKSKDAQKVKEFDIEAYTKGFTSTYTFNGNVIKSI